jgi:translation initiation factor 2B subunit (eIF-2B alpha/beta/delta family)
MIEQDVNFELINKLVKENPNNYSLGDMIRKLVNQIKNEKQTKSLDKSGN